MAKQAMQANEPRGSRPASQGRLPQGTFEIVQDRWVKFLADFTRENRGAHARLEVFGADVGYQVETENRPFDGVSPDLKGGEQAVWITFGSKLEDHLTHSIQNVTAIWVRLPSGQRGAALGALGRDGTKTVLQLSRPEAYALPRAISEASSVSA